ncbi:MAG: arylesterase [Mariprofundaceae bacterium]|nr:arylesterase [Mariprofundaceae bacterium]
MLKRYFPNLLLVFCLLFPACSSQPQLPGLAPDATILSFGDSLTYGTGAKKNESYPAVLSRLTGLNVVNAGIPGEVTTAGVARLADVLEEVQPSLLLLCHGGNDMIRKESLPMAADNLRAMITMAKQQGISVMLIAVPRPGLLLSPPEFYEQVAEEMNIPVETDVLADILSDRSLKSDTIHPNREGYRAMAERIFQLLKEVGAL